MDTGGRGAKHRMDLGLCGRVAMVAAASKGIGKACAQALAREGCRVSICARGDEAVEAARAEIAAEMGEDMVMGAVADVTRAADLEAWFGATEGTLGPVEIVVTNTGGPPAARFMALSDEQWDTGVQSTLMNVVRLSRLAIPGMAERKWGRLIHITSLVAKHPSDMLTISTTLRAGLSALTRLQSNQHAAVGITANAVLPGNTLTDRQYHLARVKAAELGIPEAEALARTAAAIPAGRMAEPSEIADVVAFLASERAAYINGVSLLVDGGAAQAVC